MPVNLSNVNISLRQFQEIAAGKYNAGEVRLTSDHTLGKINHHVHATGQNKVSLSHAEVLAIKDAFVRSLSQNGVGADVIANIRRDLGLAPNGATDTALAERSIKPLSRQQIRDILDSNKETLNASAGAGTIRTQAEKFARYSEERRASFAQTRNEVNAAMMRQRQTLPDRAIADMQAILAGDVRFSNPAERERLIVAAELQKGTILRRSHGNPSDAPNATMKFHRATDGFNVTFSLGMSEKEYVRKLDDMLVFLKTHENPTGNQAGIPALSAFEANDNVHQVLIRNNHAVPTHETETIQAGVRRELEARFGAGVFKADAPFSSVANATHVNSAFAALGNLNERRLTAAEIQAAIVAQAAPTVAKTFLSKAIAPMLKAAGGAPNMAVGVASNLFVRHTELKDRLVAAQSPAEVRAVLAEFRTQIAAGVRRQVAADRGREEAKAIFRQEIAAAMGIPVSALEGRGVLNISRLGVKSGNLGLDIGSGINAADTDEEIAQAFRDLAVSQAQERIALLRQADALPVSKAAHDILKNQILTLDKVTGFDLAAFKNRAADIQIDALVSALSSDAPAADVLAAMGAVGHEVYGMAVALAGQGAGPDEIGAASNLLVTLALDKNPRALDLVRDFFARADVAETSLVDLQAPGSRPVAFQLFKPEMPAAASNALLADAIGKPNLASLHAQAIYLALDDLGFDDLSTAEKAKLISGAAGQALARTVRQFPETITPAQLRALARVQFAEEAARHAADRYIAAFARDNGIASDPTAEEIATAVLFKRHPELLKPLSGALSVAALRGEDPAAAAKDLLSAHDDLIRVAVFSFAAIRRVNDGAVDTAVREIATRANLDLAFVREKLNASGLLIPGGSLDFLRSDIRDQLAKSETDIAAWDLAKIEETAKARVESFIAKKVAFIADADNMPISDAARGALVAETLSCPPYKDPDLSAAAGRVLNRPEIRAAIDYAKNTLTAEKVAKLSDDDVFFVFETLGAQLNAAIEAELPEAKRATMDNDDHAVIRSLLISAFVDQGGRPLLDAAERLAATGRLDTLEDAGNAAHRRYDDEYMTWSSGVNSKGQQAAIDHAKATEANKGAAAVALGMRLLAGLTPALWDEWLPAELADAVRLSKATPAQKARAAAAVRYLPGAFKRTAAGL
ncbi:MAG: hypothetical protein IJ658_09850, partial [Kiritimatiellae bacterium]|nr:hypothetical protein [Kiritimatiellia bacterium]